MKHIITLNYKRKFDKKFLAKLPEHHPVIQRAQPALQDITFVSLWSRLAFLDPDPPTQLKKIQIQSGSILMCRRHLFRFNCTQKLLVNVGENIDQVSDPFAVSLFFFSNTFYSGRMQVQDYVRNNTPLLHFSWECARPTTHSQLREKMGASLFSCLLALFLSV